MNYQAVAIIPKSNSGEYTRLRFISDSMTEEQVKAAIKIWESNSNEKVKLFTDPEIIEFAKYTRQLELSIQMLQQK